VNVRSAIKTESPSEPQPDLRAQRRAARRAENRVEILDAAELVFGEHGFRAGSLRQIAVRSGFSPAAIYLFFDNKQHLVSETLARRGAELVGALEAEAGRDLCPLDKFHAIVDVTVAFFEARPGFRRLVRHMTGGSAIVGSAFAEFASDGDGYFMKTMNLLARIVEQGQEVGEIREGNAYAIAHLFSVLVNEHILLTASGESNIVPLTAEQFHGLIDGTLRSRTR
jgi:AcrR family transcriptional regulator